MTFDLELSQADLAGIGLGREAELSPDEEEGGEGERRSQGLNALRSCNKINPLMPKRCFCASIYFMVFKKQMFQAANTELFNPLVSTAHNSERQNLLFPLQIKKPVKVG